MKKLFLILLKNFKERREEMKKIILFVLIFRLVVLPGVSVYSISRGVPPPQPPILDDDVIIIEEELEYPHIEKYNSPIDEFFGTQNEIKTKTEKQFTFNPTNQTFFKSIKEKKGEVTIYYWDGTQWKGMYKYINIVPGFEKGINLAKSTYVVWDGGLKPPPIKIIVIPGEIFAFLEGDGFLKQFQIGKYKATPLGGIAPYTYQWSWTGIPSSFTANGERLEIAWGKVGAYQVKVKIIDAAGKTAESSLNVYVDKDAEGLIVERPIKGVKKGNVFYPCSIGHSGCGGGELGDGCKGCIPGYVYNN